MDKIGKRKMEIEIEVTPETFAQQYLSTFYSFDYRPTDRKLLFNTKTAGYYLVCVTAFLKIKKRREIIGYLIIKDPNKSDRFEVVYEIFEKGFNVKFPREQL